MHLAAATAISRMRCSSWLSGVKRTFLKLQPCRYVLLMLSLLLLLLLLLMTMMTCM
jgi:hypothetical protein